MATGVQLGLLDFELEAPFSTLKYIKGPCILDELLVFSKYLSAVQIEKLFEFKSMKSQ